MQRGWTVVIVLFVARCALGYQYQTVTSVQGFLVGEQGWDYTAIGTLIGLYSLTGVFIALPAGMAGRRWGDGRMAAVGLALMAARGLLPELDTSWETLAAARIIAGTGGIFVTVLMTKMVGDWFAGGALVTAMAVLMNSWPVGVGIGLVAQGPLAEAWGWQAVFTTSGLWSAAGIALVLAVWRPAPQPSRTADASTPPRRPLSHRQVAACLLAGFTWTLYNSCFYDIFGFAAALLEARGATRIEAGATVSIVTWIYMISTPLGGALAQRLDRPNVVMVTSFALSALATASLPWTDAPLAALAIVAIFAGVPTGVVMSLPIQAVGPDGHNAAMGLYYTAHYIGLGTVPAVAGLARDLTSEPGAPMIVGAIATAPAIAMLAAFRAVARGARPAVAGT
ncbi:MAG: MFS transporter [Alphaproteobacteria bacterium]|nr:MFS transporter [Alphaproteobacteria bacterium]